MLKYTATEKPICRRSASVSLQFISVRRFVIKASAGGIERLQNRRVFISAICFECNKKAGHKPGFCYSIYFAACRRQSATASIILLDVSVAPETASTSHVLPATIADGIFSRAEEAMDSVSF